MSCSTSLSVGTTSSITLGADRAMVTAASALAARRQPGRNRRRPIEGGAGGRLAEERSERERCRCGHRLLRTYGCPAFAPRGQGVVEPLLSHTYAVDQLRGRMARRQLEPNDAAAARLDDIAADDVVGTPVGAFDEDVRLDLSDDLVRRVLVKDDRRVDARERQQQLRAFPLRD